MIKDIKDFPLLDAIQSFENGKEVIRLCNEGIEESEKQLIQLDQEFQNTPFEHEQTNIINDMFVITKHLDTCLASKLLVKNALKQFAPIYN